MSPIFSGLIRILPSVLDRLIPDPEKKAQAQLELAKLATTGELQAMAMQADINKLESQSENVLATSWRPAVGWTCALAFAYQYLFAPIGTFIYVASTGHALPAELPRLDDSITELLLGMLGLGALRTYEKVKGVAGPAGPLINR